MDVSKIKGERREVALRLGQRAGSEAVLAQSGAHLKALETHEEALIEHGGLSTREGAELRALEAQSRAALTARPDAARANTVARKTTREQELKLKATRLRTRTLLIAALEALRDDGADEDALRPLEAIMADTERAGADVLKLSKQARDLASLLEHPLLQAEVAERRGDKLIAALRSGADALDLAAADSALPRGTPAETELLDVIDGLIIERLRRVRRAARAASRALGEPALAAIFALDLLDM